MHYFKYLIAMAVMISAPFLRAQQVESVILLTIDGLHWQTPQRTDMPNFNALIKEGTYVEKSYLLTPHHPTIGDYSKYNSCSFPNPVLHSGSVFLRPKSKYIQELIPPSRKTAFTVNSTAYRSVARGFDICIMDASLSDDEVMKKSIKIIDEDNPAFIRIHLQTPGELGRSVSVCSQDKSYYRDIYGENSPYVDGIENADKLLGELVSFLKQNEKWENTVLIVTSDHGQSRLGWHAMLDEDSWVTPLVFSGKGIAKSRLLSYFEHTDLSPTIAMLLNCPNPNNDGGCGKSAKEILSCTNISDAYHPQYIKTINEQIKEFNILKAKLTINIKERPYYALLLASLENENLTPEPFYHQDRIMDWHKSGSVKHLIEANEQILKRMKEAL